MFGIGLRFGGSDTPWEERFLPDRTLDGDQDGGKEYALSKILKDWS